MKRWWWAALLAVACDGNNPGTSDGGAGGADAGVPSSVWVTAAEGGVVQSGDGVFTLIVPPNALAEDTRISIAIGEAPADVASRRIVSAYYEVEPEGLTFGGAGAYTVFRFDTAPSGLVVGNQYAMVGAFSRSDAGAIAPHDGVFPLYDEDGSLTVLTAIAHLSGHWVERGGLLAYVDFGSDTQFVDLPWAMSALRLNGTYDGFGFSGLELHAGEDDTSAAVHLPFPAGENVSEVLASALQLPGGFAEYLDTLHDVGSFSSVSFGAGVTTFDDVPVVPTPRFNCESEGNGSVFVALGATPISNVNIRAFFGAYAAVARHRVTCLPRPPVDLPRFVLFGNFTDVDPIARGWEVPFAGPGAEGAIGRVIAAEGGVTQIAPGEHVIDPAAAAIPADAPATIRVTAGPDQIVLTKEASGYGVTGLDTSVDVLAPNESATIEVGGQSATVGVGTGAPFLRGDERASGATEVFFDDGVWETLLRVTHLVPAAGPPPAQPLEYVHAQPMSELVLASGRRVGSIATPALDAYLAGSDLVILDSLICAVNEEQVGGVRALVGECTFFDGPDLTPPTPIVEMGGACNTTPLVIAGIDAASPRAQLCVGADTSSCTITSLDAGCPASTESMFTLDFDASGLAQMCRPIPAIWTPVFSTFGAFGALSCGGGRFGPTIPIDAESTMIWQREADGHLMEIVFTPSAAPNELQIASATDFSGPFPSFGAQIDCASLPHTYSAPAAGFGNYASVCGNGGCRAYGDVDATPEREFCRIDSDYYDLQFDMDLGVPRASAGYTLVSASDGTISGREVTDFAPDTDVTVVTDWAGVRVRTVFRYVSATDSFTVVSATRL